MTLVTRQQRFFTNNGIFWKFGHHGWRNGDKKYLQCIMTPDVANLFNKYRSTGHCS